MSAPKLTEAQRPYRLLTDKGRQDLAHYLSITNRYPGHAFIALKLVEPAYKSALGYDMWQITDAGRVALRGDK